MQRESSWDHGRSVHELEPPGPLLFLPLLLLQGGGMDLSRVGEKIFSSVRSARSLGLLSSTSDRPEVLERVAAAAAAARALAGLPPHERIALTSNYEDITFLYGSKGQTLEVLEEEFYEEATLRLAQLDKIAERLAHNVLEHHEELVKGMQLVIDLQQDLKVANVICMNGRRHIASSKHEFSMELVVHSHSKKKQALLVSFIRCVVCIATYDIRCMSSSFICRGLLYKSGVFYTKS
ncbi:uncharacterized protein LOC110099515 [Dendrobium catenatum]|uniref:uncharacterized protein LOC110099515 n=1 Tax=Dendrobium catenatum TaxID=906689 RepID=UPI0009F35C82|nr:uncharacterized protein LOC110099515 [Dendrobium catenatum]